MNSITRRIYATRILAKRAFKSTDLHLYKPYFGALGKAEYKIGYSKFHVVPTFLCSIILDIPNFMLLRQHLVSNRFSPYALVSNPFNVRRRLGIYTYIHVSHVNTKRCKVTLETLLPLEYNVSLPIIPLWQDSVVLFRIGNMNILNQF